MGCFEGIERKREQIRTNPLARVKRGLLVGCFQSAAAAAGQYQTAPPATGSRLMNDAASAVAAADAADDDDRNHRLGLAELASSLLIRQAAASIASNLEGIASRASARECSIGAIPGILADH